MKAYLASRGVEEVSKLAHIVGTFCVIYCMIMFTPPSVGTVERNIGGRNSKEGLLQRCRQRYYWEGDIWNFRCCSQICGKDTYICMFFFFFGVTLEVPTFIKLNHDCQACDELHAVFHGHAPSKVHCWIIDGTLSEHELWAMSWALNGIGHRIVEVSTFDWVIAVRKAKLQMYAVWQFCFLFFPFISFRLYFCSVVSLHVWAL